MFDLATSSREHRPRIRVFGLGLLAMVMLAILGMNSVACVRTGPRRHRHGLRPRDRHDDERRHPPR